MIDKILSKLKEIEEINNVEILYAIESGSRAWGFASKDSDFDVRFIYRQKLEWYLQVAESPKDSITEMQEDGLFDFAGWELRKSLRLLIKSNPTLFEYFQSPIVYFKNDEFKNEFFEFCEKAYKPIATAHHYLSMAKGNYNDYLTGDTVNMKKYLYVFRPIFALMYIEKFNQIPPMEFDALRNALTISDEINQELDMLLAKKRNSLEMDNMPKVDILNEFLIEKLKYFESEIGKFGTSSNFEIGEIDGFLSRWVLKKE